MARYIEPSCQAVDPETEQPCGRPMQIMGERDPSYGPNWRPGHAVFRCRRCGAVRALSLEHIDRYARRSK